MESSIDSNDEKQSMLNYILDTEPVLRNKSTAEKPDANKTIPDENTEWEVPNDEGNSNTYQNDNQ